MQRAKIRFHFVRLGYLPLSTTIPFLAPSHIGGFVLYMTFSVAVNSILATVHGVSAPLISMLEIKIYSNQLVSFESQSPDLVVGTILSFLLGSEMVNLIIRPR